jgi:2-oxo-4-hydroxy-4-carboxy-5-ureidoimidazoline decarboxylase
MRLEDLNALDGESATRELLRCCGSTRWARLMAEARPFADAAAMATVADAIWCSLAPADWLEAFAAHPKIGDRPTSAWASAEQSGSRTAPDDLGERLATRNRDYEARFGYIFIVCATGKTAGEMLDILERRLPNDSHEELRVAAEEQRKITRLRLAKLIETEQVTTT